jgi:prenyltransferase beta subunit
VQGVHPRAQGRIQRAPSFHLEKLIGGTLLFGAVSIRLEMLQVARLAPKLLGDSTPLVGAFLQSQITENGGGCDRAGRPDLYYTIFALAGLQALQQPADSERVGNFLRSFGNGQNLDFVHLGALARCWAALDSLKPSSLLVDGLLARLEMYRCPDGGYEAEPGAPHGNAYGCFVALGAYQDLSRPQPEPLRMVQCLKFLETPDGAWANARGLKVGSTNATAAAVTLLRQLDLPVHPSVGEWLLARIHPQGGFLAMPSAPMPDLLSTATALHALACMEIDVSEEARERCLDFIDSLWTNRGGFHGHWADEELDAEYTFYGLLALGHLAR